MWSFGFRKSFVLSPSVTADAPEESLVPAARGLNVVAVDQGLGAHGRILTRIVKVRAWRAHGGQRT